MSVWSYISLWVSNKSEFLWRHSLSLSLRLSKFTSFKQKRVLMKTFVDPQFEVMYVYEFQTKANFFEAICWVSVWNYLDLRLWNKTEFLSRHLLSLSLKLCQFMSFKQKWILMKTFLEPQFGVAYVYEFQTKVNSSDDIFWVSVWSYISLWVPNESEFLWRHLLSLILKLIKFMNIKRKQILMKTFVESQFKVT